MPTETELKLRFDERAMRRLRRHPLLAELKTGRPTSRFLKSVYFDTPDLQLRRRQIVLRIRHIGRRRIQTVKDEGQMLGGIRARGEWEGEITGDLPEMAPIEDSGLAPLFADDKLWRALTPVFVSEIRRTSHRLADAEWEIELSLDTGRVATSKDDTPICEAELELIRGQPRDLFDLALALHSDLSFSIETATKADRGYVLHTGGPPPMVKAEPPCLAPTVSSAEAFRTVAHSCLAHFLANTGGGGIRPAGEESIHQMRVALRRLRSAMGLFKGFLDTSETAWIKDEIRWLLGPLGKARDGDVFFDEILAPLAGLFADEIGFQLIEEDFRAKHRSAYEEAMAAVASDRLTRLLLRLGRWIEDGDWRASERSGQFPLLDVPVAEFAEGALRKLERRVKNGMRRLADDDESVRHKTRIHVKNLRYAIDFFESLFKSTKSRKLSEGLGVLQDRLGLLNDISVGRLNLERHAEHSRDPRRMWAAGLIAGWHLARVDGLLKRAAGDWRRVEREPRPWKR